MDYIVTELQNGGYHVLPAETNLTNVITDTNNIAHNRNIDTIEARKALEKQHREELEKVLKTKTDKIEELIRLYKIAHTQEERKTIQFEIEKFSLQKTKLISALVTYSNKDEQNRRNSYYSDREYTDEEKKIIMDLIDSVKTEDVIKKKKINS